MRRFLKRAPQKRDFNIGLVRSDPINLIDPLGLVAGDELTATYHGAAPPPSDFGSGAFNGAGYTGNSGDPLCHRPVGQCPAPIPSAPNPPQNTNPDPCASHNSVAAKVADWANTVGNGASAVAVVSGGAALVTSETVVGGLTFGGIAAGAEVVGLLATGVQAGAQYIDGNYGSMRGSLRSLGWSLATNAAVGGLFKGAEGLSDAAKAQQKYALGLHNEAGSQILQNVCR